MAHAAWKWVALAALVGGGFFAACSGDDGDSDGDDPVDAGTEQPGENVFRPGLGDDEGTPRGTPLSPPAGTRVTGTILGEDAGEGECEGAGAPPKGSGRAVWACLKLENTTGGPIEVELPDGLMLVSDTEDGQNGILVERVFFTVPPTGSTGGIDAGTDAGAGGGTPFVVMLRMYCLNESRSPSFDRMEYTLGPVTNDPALLELLGLLAGKTIDNDAEKSVVQTAIYNITEGKGLTNEDRAALRRL